MTTLLVVPMAVALLSSTVEPCPDEDDPLHTVLIADPSDCTAFFVCFNGIPIRHLCPAGLHFNDRLDVCEWPKDAKCETGGKAESCTYPCYSEITIHKEDGTLGVVQKTVYMEGTACTGGEESCTPNNPC